MYYIKEFIKHDNNTPIFKNIMEHRGKNKGELKIFKSMYSTNKYIKKYGLDEKKHYIYIFRKGLNNGL